MKNIKGGPDINQEVGVRWSKWEYSMTYQTLIKVVS